MGGTSAQFVVSSALAALCVIQTSLFVLFTVRHADRQQLSMRQYGDLMGRAWQLQHRCTGRPLNASDGDGDQLEVRARGSRLAARADPYIEHIITQQVAMLERHCSNETKLCLPGPKGDPGVIGHIGLSGPTGPQGDQAAKGNNGAIGDPGLKGAPGVQGPGGVTGHVGASGQTGLKGDPGSSGPRGETAVKGVRGPSGAKGPAGPNGDPGLPGPLGDPGVDGAAGSKGEPGSTGGVGLAGNAGAKGVAAPKRNCSCVAAPNTNGATLQKVDVIPGSTLTLTCPITAIPKPDVIWSRAPQALPSSATSVGNQLIITDFKLSDVGKYTCTANNVIGSAVVAFDVKLTDLTCNFEVPVGLCSWQQGTADNQDWHLQKGLTPTLRTGPSADHTVGTASGQYIYLESSDGASGDKADLESPPLVQKTPMCLDFWYNMNGQGIATLYVLVKDAAGNETVIWSRSGEQGVSWKESEVTVFPPADGGPTKVVFRATRGPSNDGDIALDDVTVTSGVCIEPPDAASCDFSRDTCQWSVTGDWAWTLHAGSSGKLDTGPLANRRNNTQQKYLYANGASTQTAGSKARLVSPIIDTTSKVCVDFYYNLHGNTEGSLKLIVKSQDNAETVLWQRSGDQTQAWHHAKMTLPQSSVPVNLVLEATRGSGPSSDVAVDDFAVEPGACSYNGLGCDFEELDLCTWTQEVHNDNFDWDVQVASSGGRNGGPTVDNTLQTDQGHYVSVQNAGHTAGQKASLMSRLLPRNTDYCLAMWVYIPTAASGSLSVDREMYGSVREHIHTIGYHAPLAGQQAQWTMANVTIPGYWTDSGVYLQATTGNTTAPPICVDDVTLNSGACA